MLMLNIIYLLGALVTITEHLGAHLQSTCIAIIHIFKIYYYYYQFLAHQFLTITSAHAVKGEHINIMYLLFISTVSICLFIAS